ncbi:ATP-binding cassette domain-containing protein [Streptomyces sp. NPDC085612]|uniref:ATP-binding cassette domain-containing protein n=1 Tax=Streptomyces sp. NPDC085612 TaxID=3365732 RepID=UPI0037D3DE2B
MGERPAIELTGLTKRYGPVVGVDGLTLSVCSGEVFGFLGPNGAGKTTTLRCLIGLLRPTEGRVRVLGLDPVADHLRVAPHLGHLPGELRLYPELSGAETLDLLSALQGAPVPCRGELCEPHPAGGSADLRAGRDRTGRTAGDAFLDLYRDTDPEEQP